ncbi:UDP-glucose 4-epimerase family protein [Pararobbsia alpina]|uniref:GDP-6-deoxy-D-mannose reductase n=1 Tax=Pararobbsia alpina TaxID=621374 RepID=A0A6S7BUH8_9BURK|nr:SDR family oxidoreductase [Pararobbsia alpina]CAB3803182.1 GDP-6-deoxy-D-mannose reductase [Pararobbsia alpina]
MTTTLVSGATGFVGQAVTKALGYEGREVVRLTRRPVAEGDLVAGDDFVDVARVWPHGFRPDCVVHLAARVHVMRDTAADPLQAFRAVNVDATLRVAEAAARAGTRRFVYISSIKAAGELSLEHPLRESDPPFPLDPYGVTKREAEVALLEFGERVGMEVAVVRPPLVYGPGVGANFMSLMKAVDRGLPLPLGLASAPRSLVAVDNLASAILACMSHPRATGEIFHVSDGEDVSVAELIRQMAAALDTRARLVSVPTSLLKMAGSLTGRSDAVQRLIEPLQVDITKIRSLLGWNPPLSVLSGLRLTAAWYRSTSHSSTSKIHS